MNSTSLLAEIKWTVSKGVNTYGYNICTLYIGGGKVAACNGGGYDMVGTVWGMWLQAQFQDRLKTIPVDRSKFYGMGENTKGLRYLDGACGDTCMLKIANQIGIDWFSAAKPNKRGQSSGKYFVRIYDVVGSVEAESLQAAAS